MSIVAYLFPVCVLIPLVGKIILHLLQDRDEP